MICAVFASSLALTQDAVQPHRKDPATLCQVMSDGYILQCGSVTVAIDYWTAPHAAAFFLTHMHADHYKGLRNDWCQGTIYCSELTRLLLLQKWPRLRANVILVDEPTTIQLPKDEAVTVTAFNANHCPVSKPADCKMLDCSAPLTVALTEYCCRYIGGSHVSLRRLLRKSTAYW